MDRKKIEEILGEIKFNVLGFNRFKWRILKKGDGYLIQLGAYLPSNVGPKIDSLQKGRKFYVSSHAITDEVVMCAWRAVQAYVEHEIRETFLYKGVAIFHPHIPVDSLVKLIPIVGEAKRSN